METTGNTVLLETVNGSRLYGLTHVGSDHDVYRVVSSMPGKRKNKASHIFAGEDDVFTVDLQTFFHQIAICHPYALDAMFSQQANVDMLSAYRNGFRVSIADMHASYRERIIVESRHGLKQRRHALRWALNFRDAVQNGGWFNPTLSDSDAQLVRDHESNLDFCEALREVWPYEISLQKKTIIAKITQEMNDGS